MKLVKKIVVTFFSVIMMCQGLYANTNNDIEAIYDNKIKAIQSLPDTYVIGNAIGDFNGDGVKDLMISKVEDAKGYARLTFLCFTYKNGKMIKIAEDNSFVEWWCEANSGNYCPHGEVMIVSSADGKKNLLKVISEDNWGACINYYKVGKNLKWEQYLRKTNPSERIKHIDGEEDSYFKNGQNITMQEYNKEIGYYPNAKMLYTYVPSGAICAQADKYNAVNDRIVVATDLIGDSESCKYVLMYADKVLSTTELGNKRSQDLYK